VPLCALCASVVNKLANKRINHRGTEDTEAAQRIEIKTLPNQPLALTLPTS